MTLPLHDCGPVDLDKLTGNYFLKTLWDQEQPSPSMGEEPGCKPSTLLGAGIFWVPLGSVGIIVGFQFYYLCLKTSLLKLLILARCYFIPSHYFICFSSPDTDIRHTNIYSLGMNFCFFSIPFISRDRMLFPFLLHFHSI